MKRFGTAIFVLLITIATLLAVESDSFAMQDRRGTEKNENKISNIRYELSLSNGAVAAELLVSLEFRATQKSVLIGLPIDRGYGYRNSANFVASLDSEGETVVKAVEGKDNQRMLSTGDDKTFRLTYKLAVDPKVVADASFAPNAGASHFHAFFSQWMLDLGNRDQKCSFKIKWLNIPKGWQTYISLEEDAFEFEAEVTQAEMERAAIGAIKGNLYQFESNGKPVSVYVSSAMEMDSIQIGKSIEKIVRLERKLFEDDTAAFFRIVVLPRPKNVAGVAIESMFVCFVKPDISQMQLDMLIAHEMLHTWIAGTKIGFGPPEERAENFVRNQWFIEGFTEYISRKVLLDAGLISKQQFIELVNQDVIDSANNQYRNCSFEKLFKDANEGKWGAEMAKLGYYRGSLIAFRWECLLEETGSKKSVLDIVVELYRLAKTSEGHRLTTEQFFSTFEKYGLPASKDVESVVIAGSTPELPSAQFVTDSKLTQVTVPLFDPGFDLDRSQSTGNVESVKPGGPADAAGLRNGMKIIEYRNANRFSRAWQRNLPFQVSVLEGGTEKTVSFHPTGEKVDVLIYR